MSTETETEAEILFRSHDLTKRHGSVTALDSIDLEIRRGEIIGLVGANGAGKSTLLSILSGEYPATSGTMELAGEPYAPESREAALFAGVSSIEQRLEVDHDRVVAEAIFASSYQGRYEFSEKVRLAREVMSQYGIDIDPEARLGDIMRAEQTFVCLIRTMFEESQLLLLDEISATFNDYEIAVFHQIAARLCAEGRAIVFISHRLDEVRSLAHRIVVMRKGKIFRTLTGGEKRKVDLEEQMFAVPGRELPKPAPLEEQKPLLSVEELTTAELSPISLTLHRGEVLGVTGMRRSGHVMLAEALAGHREITGGTVRFEGEEVHWSTPEEAAEGGVTYLPEDDDQTGVSTTDSIASAAKRRQEGVKVEESTFFQEANELREVLADLKHLHVSAQGLHDEVGTLSVGDQHKIALAKHLGAERPVVILNHPTRGIDVLSRTAVYEMVRELTENGVGVLLISSDMSELITHAHRIAVLRDGELVDVLDNEHITEDTVAAAAIGEDLAPAPSRGRRGRRARRGGGEGSESVPEAPKVAAVENASPWSGQE